MANEIIKKENQQRVLKKAIELCSEKGLEQMSLNQLARESMLSVCSIYRYYDTKDALIKKIVEIAVANRRNIYGISQATRSARRISPRLL